MPEVDFSHPASAALRIIDPEIPLIEVTPRRKKVALVGFSPASRDEAPFTDPDWELWALNQLNRFIPRADRWFEMHRNFREDVVRDTDYVGWLRQCPLPIYMCERQSEIPTSVRYPIEQAVALWNETTPPEMPEDYYQSSIAFMVALAILEGFEEIALYGVDLIIGAEWAYQKPNCEAWLGLAKGRGIRVRIPRTSAIFKATYRYGYQVGPTAWPFPRSYFADRVTFLEEKYVEFVGELQQWTGAEAEAALHAANFAALHPEIPADAPYPAGLAKRLAFARERVAEGRRTIEQVEAALTEARQRVYDWDVVERGGTIEDPRGGRPLVIPTPQPGGAR